MKMKKLMLTIVALATLTAGVAQAEHHEPWFDLENCGMCKNLMKDRELFSAMQWETKLFANGLIEITTVPAAYEERFDQLMADMEAAGARMMAGEKMPLCGMCQSYGKLMMAGVSMDQMQAGEAHISVISSRDPDTVELIREHGRTTIEQMKTWMDSDGGHEHAGPDHSGHGR